VPSLLRALSGQCEAAPGWICTSRCLAVWLRQQGRRAHHPVLTLRPHGRPPSPCTAAPVHLTVEGQTDEDLLHLLAYDTGGLSSQPSVCHCFVHSGGPDG